MLFFGVFLRETAHPVAKSRTNLAQIQEKLPNRWTDWHQIWHTCADSSGNGYMPNQWGSGTWYPLDVAPGDETEHIIAQACKMVRKTSTPMQIMCYEKK